MKFPKRLSIKQVIILGVAIGVLFTVYCIASPPENVQWTGFKKDTETSSSEETTQNGKKITTTKKEIFGSPLWDSISILGVPLSLTGLGFWLQQQQQKRIEEQAKLEKGRAELERARIEEQAKLEKERIEEQAKLEKERIEEQAKLEKEIAENNQKEEVLQAYFDRLSTLLVDKNLIAIATKLKKANEAGNNQGEAVAGDRDADLDEQKELLDAAVDAG